MSADLRDGGDLANDNSTHSLTLPTGLQSPEYVRPNNNGAMISTLGPWVIKLGDDPGTMSYGILSPGDALRSDPGIMSGEPSTILKAVAFDILLGCSNAASELLSITLSRSAIAALEANAGSMSALDTVLRRVQVRVEIGELCA